MVRKSAKLTGRNITQRTKAIIKRASAKPKQRKPPPPKATPQQQREQSRKNSAAEPIRETILCPECDSDLTAPVTNKEGKLIAHHCRSCGYNRRV